MLTKIVNVGTALIPTLVRAGTGISVGPLGPRPQKRLTLYDFEACPYCRKVREALSILDLDAEIYPCPRNGPRFRPEATERGGRSMFPYLVDPNTNTEMYESDDIVQYLFEHYGDGRVPTMLALGILTDVGSAACGLARPGFGAFYREARQPEELLELFSFEGSPFCRMVRERLSSLELPYILHNVAKGSPRRDEFVARSGKMQVPYLVDPNTETALFESADIVAYLDRQYAAD